MMKSSANARRIRSYFEGREYKAYKDPLSKNGLPITIGIGHTGNDVNLGLVWNDAQIDAAFAKDVADSEKIANDIIKVTVNQHQFDAIVSLIFNVGAGRKASANDAGKDGIAVLKNGEPSTLIRKLNAGDYAGCANEFLRWCRSGGVKSLGLYRARMAEKLLFGGESAEFAINTAAKINAIPE